MQERKAWSVDGILAVVVALVLTGLGAWLLARMGIDLEAGTGNPVVTGVIGGLLVLAAAVLFSSLTIISPGDTNVVQFFGRYVGTIRKAGLLMTVPFTTKKKVSVKVRNFETSELKVNDADGNPVNIAAIIVWQVADTAKSVFAVEAYDTFVAVQAESALRHVATSHPYDNAAPGEETLRGSTGAVAEELAEEVAARIAIAGPGGRRDPHQLAGLRAGDRPGDAPAAAGPTPWSRPVPVIVDGAVGMVQMALERLRVEGRGWTPRRGAQGPDGVEPAGGAHQRLARLTGDQHGLASRLRRLLGGCRSRASVAAPPPRPAGQEGRPGRSGKQRPRRG